MHHLVQAIKVDQRLKFCPNLNNSCIVGDHVPNATILYCQSYLLSIGANATDEERLGFTQRSQELGQGGLGNTRNGEPTSAA